MFRKNKHHYFHHTSRRYEDGKIKERFAVIGLAAGIVLGGCIGGIIGAIIGGLFGAAVIGFIGHIVVTFR